MNVCLYYLVEDLKHFCQRFDIPIPENKLDDVPFYLPPKTSPEIKYLHAQRKALGGYLPSRYPDIEKLIIPKLKEFESLLGGMEDREISTTMAFVRMLVILLKD